MHSVVCRASVAYLPPNLPIGCQFLAIKLFAQRSLGEHSGLIRVWRNASSLARSSRTPEDVCFRASALAYLQWFLSNVASDVMAAHDKCVPDLGSSSPFSNHQAWNHGCHAEWPMSGWKTFSRSPFLLRARYRSNAQTLDASFISLSSLNLGV